MCQSGTAGGKLTARTGGVCALGEGIFSPSPLLITDQPLGARHCLSRQVSECRILVLLLILVFSLMCMKVQESQ